ncbi:DUF3231 family protein [Paenibacillus sp. YYML68]|uniref:DUF3231 family protein n=1 Tax=Paenibacillus sp. YYML68 TaxID=2909250 RepID=UPI0024910F2E|nr:DUF3231 family protein [Paenibacillus sp. YYML68]
MQESRSENKNTLTASEIGYVWSGYMIDAMSIRFLSVFLEQVQEERARSVLQIAMQLAVRQNEVRRTLLSGEQFPIPLGFKDEEVRPDMPALFTDRFFLHYMMNASRLGLHYHAECLSVSVREDMRQFASQSLGHTIELYRLTVEQLRASGEYTAHPSIPAPEQPEHIQKESFLQGWLGDTRPLHSMEIANLYKAAEIIAILEALCTAFAQTAQDPEVRTLLQRARMQTKQLSEQIAGMLTKDDLPLVASREADVTGTTRASFSDRLMLCHVSGMMGSFITHCGQSLGSVMKHDLLVLYMELIAEAGTLTEEATKLLIAREWLEKTPGAVDRAALIR